MSCIQNNPTCPGIPVQPVTLVAVSQTSYRGRPLQAKQLTGSEPHEINNVKFPGEGFYVICKNTALQIAAAACSRKECYKSGKCSCVNEDTAANQHFNRNNFASYYTGEPCNFPEDDDSPSHPMPCHSCLYHWLDLDTIAANLEYYGFNVLTAPMTMKLTFYLGSLVVSDNEEYSTMLNTMDDFDYMDDISADIPECPPHLQGWMLAGWQHFIDSQDFTPTGTSLPWSTSATSSTLSSSSPATSLTLSSPTSPRHLSQTPSSSPPPPSHAAPPDDTSCAASATKAFDMAGHGDSHGDDEGYDDGDVPRDSPDDSSDESSGDSSDDSSDDSDESIDESDDEMQDIMMGMGMIPDECILGDAMEGVEGGTEIAESDEDIFKWHLLGPAVHRMIEEEIRSSMD